MTRGAGSGRVRRMRRPGRAFLLVLLAAGALGAPLARAVDPSAAVRVTELLRTGESWDGQPVAYPPGRPLVTSMIVEVAPGGETGWHHHPVPSFGYVLSGTIDVTLEDGRRRRFSEGDAIVEVVGRRHNGRNAGTTPVRLVLFYAGDESTPVTVR